MLWDGLAVREGQGPSPRVGCMSSHPGPANGEVGDGGGRLRPQRFGCLWFCPRRVVWQGGVVASDVQVASAQGSWLWPGPLSPEDVSFLCYMGTGQSKALSYARLYLFCRCQATAPVQRAAPGREGL